MQCFLLWRRVIYGRISHLGSPLVERVVEQRIGRSRIGGFEEGILRFLGFVVSPDPEFGRGREKLLDQILDRLLETPNKIEERGIKELIIDDPSVEISIEFWRIIIAFALMLLLFFFKLYLFQDLVERIYIIIFVQSWLICVELLLLLLLLLLLRRLKIRILSKNLRCCKEQEQNKKQRYPGEFFERK